MPVAYIPGMCDMPGEVVSGSSYALHVIYVYTDYRIGAPPTMEYVHNTCQSTIEYVHAPTMEYVHSSSLITIE